MKLATPKEILASGEIQRHEVEVFDRKDKIGKGLRTKRPYRKNEKIAVIFGKLRTVEEATCNNYSLRINSKYLIDCRPSINKPTSERSPFTGCYANDAKGLVGKRNNAAFEFGKISTGGEVAWLIATHPIAKGEEVFVKYGSGYWRNYPCQK